VTFLPILDSEPTPASAPRGSLARWRALGAWAATAGLVAVVLGVSGFAWWAAQATAASATTAVSATALSDDFAAAARAVAVEESLERKYRLEPGPQIRTQYDQASADLVTAANTLRREGRPEDRVLAETVLETHKAYLQAIDRMFAAVDVGDTALATRIDGEEVDPTFGVIQKQVTAAAAAHHRQAAEALSELQSLASFTERTTPLVFMTGVAMVLIFGMLMRRAKRLVEAQHRQALHDSLHDRLTGLPNRTLLADRLEQALRSGRREQTTTGLLLIDLDRFKEVNDTLGHHYGDALLQQIGPRLSSALRDVDSVARLGGDEFAVLLPTVSGVDAALAVAEKLRHALTAPFVVDDVALDVEASIGVVISGQHGQHAATLLQRADVAMYVAKEQNLGVFGYDPQADAHSPERLAVLGDLRRGLDRGELFLHYQPKVSLSTGEVVGAEALVRWSHPERGIVAPDDFIPLAEHTGLIGPLTLYVLDAALAQVRSWLDEGHRVPVAVNLSARNLLDQRLSDQIVELLATHRVRPDMLRLEVTESAIMTDPTRAQALLARLHKLGVAIAIDDFGAGYTSLAQLKTLPVTELKIDRSFVTTMDTDVANALIVRSVVDLGHNLGLTTIAEGVETQASMDTLTGYGCDIVQGYHLARPLAAADFLTWYEAHSAERQPARPSSGFVAG
jgi:diguanylate cyclase